MRWAGLSVPNAFLVTSLTCKEYIEASIESKKQPKQNAATNDLFTELQSQLTTEYWKAIHSMESLAHASFGVKFTSVESLLFSGLTERAPLLLSVRASLPLQYTSSSCAKASTKDLRNRAVVSEFQHTSTTVLNVGMNDDVLQYMIKTTRNERWAFDCYRRFLYVRCSMQETLKYILVVIVD